MDTPKHTPLPWLVGAATPLRPTYTVFHRPFGLGDVAEVSTEADAEYIVRACNVFPALVEALESMMKSNVAFPCDSGGRLLDGFIAVPRDAFNAAREALRQAKGEE